MTRAHATSQTGSVKFNDMDRADRVVRESPAGFQVALFAEWVYNGCSCFLWVMDREAEP